ncbi:MAG: hypothetical protein SFV24_12975 [Gemmatimonadales bacterium]|nr:hypothetical protein [Gemmatimonadota bacterium]MCC7132427.1 hypothetical protein [Gemmatimonadales bacterium]MDX2058710.1 hypothetical protein [Gemmatimonadales bacterium]
MKATKAVAFSAALVTGFAVGWFLAGRHVERHKEDLFSSNRFRRLAALSYLAGQTRVETLRLLADYIAWEPTAALRKRAVRLRRRMELELAAS